MPFPKTPSVDTRHWSYAKKTANCRSNRIQKYDRILLKTVRKAHALSCVALAFIAGPTKCVERITFSTLPPPVGGRSDAKDNSKIHLEEPPEIAKSYFLTR